MSNYCFKNGKIVYCFLTFFALGVQSYAEDITDMVFSGKAEKEVRIDFSRYNRISFLEDSFFLSSSKEDPQVKDLILSYSDLNHLEFRSPTPIQSEIKEITLPTMLNYSPTEKTLNTILNSDTPLQLTIFTSEGKKVLSGLVTNGMPLDVSSLSSGLYIAVGVADHIQVTLKFIIT